jgi:hypothetical protein
MQTFEFFKTPIYVEGKPEFLKSLNKASDKYIKDAKKKEKEHIKKYGDFGISYCSPTLTIDNNFRDFRDYIGLKSWEFLDSQGFDMQQYTIMFTELCVQEFAKKGGAIIQLTFIQINTCQVFIF